MTADFERTEPTRPAPAETPAPAPPPASNALWAVLGGCLLYLGYFTAMTLFNAHPPAIPASGVGQVAWALFAPLTTVGYLLVLVITINLLCRQVHTARRESLLMFACLACFLLLNPTVYQVVQRVIGGEGLITVLQSLSTAKSSPVLDVLVPFFLILTGVFFGQLIARLVKERALLVPVALVAGLIDFWGVYWGPVSAATENAGAAVSSMATAATAAVTVPEAAYSQLPERLQYFASIAPPSNIGIGDFVFLAFFLTCAYRLGLSARRTMWGIFVGLLLASLLIALDQQTVFGIEMTIEYLPGLVFICGGVLLANIGNWRLSRQEWAMTALVTGLLVALISVFAVRAELAKPQQWEDGYALTPQPVRQAVDGALARARQDRHVRGAFIPVYAEAVYRVERAGITPLGWGVLALSRPAKANLRNTREIAILGQLPVKPKTGWLVYQKIASPPVESLVRVANARSIDGRELAIINQARPLPAASLAALEHPERYVKRPQPGDQIVLYLTPRGVRGQLVTKAQLTPKPRRQAMPPSQPTPR